MTLVSIVLNAILNANYFTPHTLITPSNSRLSRLRFRFFAWTDRRVTNWFCICICIFFGGGAGVRGGKNVWPSSSTDGDTIDDDEQYSCLEVFK